MLAKLLLLAFSSFVLANEEAIPVLSLQANAPRSVQNGLPHVLKKMDAEKAVVDLELDSGWFKFFFGQADEPTAYIFRIQSNDYVQISITDAYCPGDAWDVNINSKYLFTTPRVPTRTCATWTDNPDVAFYNPIWSSTKFMLPGSFNLTLWTKDSPYKGGAAFIRADSRIVTCPDAVSPFFLVTAPKVPYEQRESLCKRIGGVPAHITPSNALAASKSMSNCLGPNARVWFGRLSIVQMSVLKSLQAKNLGCLALSNLVPEDPTVEVVDCESLLPVLCVLSSGQP